MSNLIPNSAQPIQKLRPHHEEMIQYLIANPDLTLTEVAAKFGKTVGWMSQLVNSDLFQARIAQIQEMGLAVGVLSVKEKMAAVASIGLDRLAEQLPSTQDVGTVADATNKILQRMGYSTQKAPTVVAPGGTVNLGVVDREALREARELTKAVKAMTKPLSSHDDQGRDAEGNLTDQGNVIDSVAEIVPEGT